MTISDVLADAREKMDLAVEVAKDDFSTITAGRANPALFQKVLVDYYGSPTPLAQLASLQNQEARVLLITPFDKSALKEIEKALVSASHLGATVGNDGTVIRATIPELTQDRRKEYVKLARDKAEAARVVLRSLRRSTREALDRLDGVGDDEIGRAEKELDAATKTHVDAIDTALKHKEAELLEV
ncbi:MAG: ribosome recycling factor [Micrococcales bacterium 73-13]|nr:MAG: ribosome recycling factor [Micrococcales bacterium 73-13]